MIQYIHDPHTHTERAQKLVVISKHAQCLHLNVTDFAKSSQQSNVRDAFLGTDAGGGSFAEVLTTGHPAGPLSGYE